MGDFMPGNFPPNLPLKESARVKSAAPPPLLALGVSEKEKGKVKFHPSLILND